MKKFVSGLLLSSSDVLNAQDALASTTSLAPTIQNTTHSSTGRVLGGGDGRRRRAGTRQPQDSDSDAGISKEGILGICVGASVFVSAVGVVGGALCYSKTPPRTTTDTQVDQEPADISTASGTTTPGTATPRSTISSMTAETIGAEIQI